MSEDLWRAALATRERAYAPYSGFQVGTALRADDGRIFTGCNVENASYSQAQCSEATAVGCLIAGGARRLVEICIVAVGDEPVGPCGGCRQRLWEFGAADVPLHLADLGGIRRTFRLGELLPFAFGPHNLATSPAPPSAVDRLARLQLAREARTAIVLGSGLGGLVDAMTDTETIPYAELPGFPSTDVQGHAGEVVAGRLNGVPLLCLKGRAHLYEGLPAAAVNPPIRALKALGIRLLVLTNAAGAIADRFEAGDLVLLADHINALGANPLVGPNDPTVGPRFPDLSDVYDAKLRGRLRTVAAADGIGLGEGVYLATLGPSFETPAETRAFKVLGADLVGMSTVPEAIAARHAGLKVLGFSAVTNKAAGLKQGGLSHDETLAVGAIAGEKLKAVLTRALPELHHEL